MNFKRDYIFKTKQAPLNSLFLKKNEFKGFTIIELTIVMVITSILTTIWFIVYSWHLSSARDANRSMDMESLIGWLRTSKIRNFTYPKLNDYFSIANMWSWYVMQWKLDDKIDIEWINNVQSDPLHEIKYIYSTTSNWRNFQIWMTLENWWTPIAFVDWDYKTITKRMFPSLIFALNWSWILDVQSWVGSYTSYRDYFVVNKWTYNLPYDFKTGNPIKTALNFDNIVNEDWVIITWANSYKSCDEIYNANKSMWPWEYQLMSSPYIMSDTICFYISPLLVFDENTNLSTLDDTTLKNLFSETLTWVVENTLTDKWDINWCSWGLMNVNTWTFLWWNQTLSNIVLSSNTIYKVPAGNYNLIWNTQLNTWHISFASWSSCIWLIWAWVWSTIFTTNLTWGWISNYDWVINARYTKNIIVSWLSLTNSRIINRYNYWIMVSNWANNLTLKDINSSNSQSWWISLDSYNDHNYMYNINSFNNGQNWITISYYANYNKLDNIKSYSNSWAWLLVSTSVGNNLFNINTYSNWNYWINLDSSSNLNTLDNIKSYLNWWNGIWITYNSDQNTISWALSYSNNLNWILIDSNWSWNILNNVNSYSNSQIWIILDSTKNTKINNSIIYSNWSDGINIFSWISNTLSWITTYSNWNNGVNIYFWITNTFSWIISYSNVSNWLYMDTSSWNIINNTTSNWNGNAWILLNKSTYNTLSWLITYSNSNNWINFYNVSQYNNANNITSYLNTWAWINFDNGSLSSNYNSINKFNSYSNTNWIYIWSSSYNNIFNWNIYNNIQRWIFIYSIWNILNNLNIYNNNTSNTLYYGSIEIDASSNGNKYNSLNNLNIYNNSKNWMVINANSDSNLFSNLSIFNNSWAWVYVSSWVGTWTFNNLNTYNNISWVEDYANVLTNKYYWTFKYFWNDWNSNITYLKVWTLSTLWFLDWTINTTWTMSCDYHNNPNNAFYYWASCINRWSIWSLVAPILNYTYWTLTSKQQRPVKWNWTAWELYWTAWVDYNTWSYIWQWLIIK